jgi:hypothetical protein
VIEALLKLLGIANTTEAANQAQVVSAAIACVGATIAVAAAALVLLQVRAARSIQREAIARQTYNEYLRLCFAEPAFASGNWDKTNSAGLSKELLFEKYEWFVSVMLNACESILLHVADQDEWSDAIRSQIGYHSKYIKSDDFQKNYAAHYSSELRKLLL